MVISSYPNVLAICDKYQGILLDAYGVFWGGNAMGPLPGALLVMEELVRRDKIVGILSNSTQLVTAEINKFGKNGLFQNRHFHFFVSSGEIAKSLFLEEKLPFETPQKKFWLLSKGHPHFTSALSLFQDTAYRETERLEDADFIYIGIPHLNGKDQTDPEIFRSLVQTLKKTDLPMVCANPDRFAHEGQPPTSVVRQGSLAALYESLGGMVFYIGKPYSLAYQYAMQSFANYGILTPTQVLMVGDTPETDIYGANQFGMDAALVTKTGMMAERISAQGWEKCFQELPLYGMPNFFIERLA